MTDAIPTASAWDSYHDGMLFNTAEVDSEFITKHAKQQQQLHSHPLLASQTQHQFLSAVPMECVIAPDQPSASLFSPSHSHHLSSTSTSDRSPLSHHSRSSSPFSSSHTSTSHPLDSPVHHQAQWADPADLLAAGAEAESEGESSLHSGSAHQSGVSTPFAHLHTPQTQSLAPLHALPAPQILSPPAPSNLLLHLQQGGVHPMLMLPTINEHLMAHHCRPQALKPAGGSATNLFLSEQEELPELHLPAQQPHMQQQNHIGMLPASMMMMDAATEQPAGGVSSNASTPSNGDRVCVRAKRRTRYTTAAAASVAARASLSGGAVTSPIIEHSAAPAAQPVNGRSSSYMSGSASGQSSDGDAEANEEADEQKEDVGEVDEDDDSYSGNSVSNNKKSKRKRGGASTTKSAAGSSQGDSPQLKGLDKRERNKLSASMYRKRRKVYLDSLEGKVGELDETIMKQGDTISKMAAENKALKEQLSFFKRMVAQINPGLVSTTASQAQHQQTQPVEQQQQSQASNVHYGAQRNVRGQLANFMMVVISCILLMTGGGFFVHQQEGSAVAPAGGSAPSGAIGGGMPELGSGPRRKLLSVDHLESVVIDAAFGDSFSAVLSASPAEISAKFVASSLDVEVAAALRGLVLEDAVARFNATLSALETAEEEALKLQPLPTQD